MNLSQPQTHHRWWFRMGKSSSKWCGIRMFAIIFSEKGVCFFWLHQFCPEGEGILSFRGDMDSLIS